MYHFLSGYTAKVAGTEKGVTEPQATFSTCFGAPFLPRHPSEYGNLLKRPDRQAQCRLLAGQHRLDRRRLRHRQPHADQGDPHAADRRALNGSLKDAEFRTDANFGFEVPVSVDGVDDTILTPRETWADKAAYDVQAAKLVDMFVSNFEAFEDHVDGAVKSAAPACRIGCRIRPKAPSDQDV